jgi:putative inorganic carbon (HCO3(-)) transporter
MYKTDSISKLLLVVISFVPLILAPGTNDFFYYPKILVVYLLTLVMLGICFMSRTQQLPVVKKHSVGVNQSVLGNQVYLESGIRLSLTLYVSMLIVSTFFSIDPVMSVWGRFRREEGLFAIATYIMLFGLAKRYTTLAPELSVRVMPWILGSASLVSLYGIFQYFNLDPIVRDELRTGWSSRAFSTMGNPNFLGSYLVLMLPIGVFAFLKDQRWWQFAASVIMYTCLLMTFTRSALVGIAVSFVVLLLFVIGNKASRKPFLLLMAVFVTVTIVVNTHSDGAVGTRFSSIGMDAKAFVQQEENAVYAGANRGYIWMRTLPMVMDRPLVGYGLENLQPAFIEKYEQEMLSVFGAVYAVDKAHNEYLHIAVTTGIPSLLAYLSFLVLCMLRGYRNLHKSPGHIALFASVLGYLAQAFFNVSVVSVAYIFWVFLGTLISEPEKQLAHSVHNGT